MRLITYKTILMILMTFSLALTTGPLTAQVYKVVDENGNITYTDRPPADGSKPMDLPPLSIIEVPAYQRPADRASTLEEGEEIPLKTLRRDYRDFVITSPSPEESLWQPEEPVTISWSVGTQLQAGMNVLIFVDGKLLTSSTKPMIPATGLERGAHTITAQLKDAKNRTIATAPPVTFYIRQPTIYSNRARPGG